MLKIFSEKLWKNLKLLCLIWSQNGSFLLNFQQLMAPTSPLNVRKGGSEAMEEILKSFTL